MAQKEIVGQDNYIEQGSFTRENVYRMDNYAGDRSTALVYQGKPQDAPDTAIYVFQILHTPFDGSGSDLPNARVWRRQEDGSFKELTREDE